MAYTLRTTEKDEKNLKTLMAATGDNSVSKALLRAAKDLPKMIVKIEELEKKLASSDAKVEAMRYAYTEKCIAVEHFNNLMEMED